MGTAELPQVATFLSQNPTFLMTSSLSRRPLPPPAPSRRPPPEEPSPSRDTGVRVRADAPEAPEFEAPEAVVVTRNSVTPDALRKPYASLTPPPKKSTTDSAAAESNRRDTGPRPRIASSASASQTWDDASSLSSAGKARSSRAMCKQHKIARGKDGACVLCRREEVQKSSGAGWKLIVGLITVAVVGSAIAAAMI